MDNFRVGPISTFSRNFFHFSDLQIFEYCGWLGNTISFAKWKLEMALPSVMTDIQIDLTNNRFSLRAEEQTPEVVQTSTSQILEKMPWIILEKHLVEDGVHECHPNTHANMNISTEETRIQLRQLTSTTISKKVTLHTISCANTKHGPQPFQRLLSALPCKACFQIRTS